VKPKGVFDTPFYFKALYPWKRFKSAQGDVRMSGENNKAGAEKKQERQKNSAFSEIFMLLEDLALMMGVAVLLFIFVIRPTGVIGDSMNSTLHDKDKLLVSNLLYEPRQGDIVVLTKKSFMTESIVKRVVAVEGQTIDVDYETNQVYVDGVALWEPYRNEPNMIKGTINKQFEMEYPAVVPEGHIFVMGDNRNHSIDSRHISLGMVDKRYILGRAVFRIWPLDVFGAVK